MLPVILDWRAFYLPKFRRMGGENLEVTDGRITFEGDESMIARANIGLRTAERVQLVLGRFEARSFEELFQGVKKIPFEDYIGKKGRLSS